MEDLLITTTAGRKAVRNAGFVEGMTIAQAEYPHGIVQDEDLKQLAELTFQNWQAENVRIWQAALPHRPSYESAWEKEKARRILENWKTNLNEARRIYVAAFIGRYMEEVEARDKEAVKRGKKPVLTASATGASIKIVSIDRSADRYIYTIEISDPGYLSQPVVFIAPIPKS